jgi:hypothetical protein
MVFEAQVLAVVIGFMVLANRLVEMLVTPLFEKFEWDKFWIMYVAWIVSGALVAFTQLNLFEAFIPNQIIGMVLTAIVSGGGANMLHDITDQGIEIIELPEVE